MDYLAILPEISLVVLAAILLVVDLRLSKAHKENLAYVTFGGFVLIFVLTILFSRPETGQDTAIWFGMLRHDTLAFVFRLVFMVGAAITSLLAVEWDTISKRGEFYILLVFSTLGMNLMAGAGNLVMLFISIETATIPLYAMAGFMKEDDKSTEAGFKYLLFGAMTSAVMLYGFSLLYGFAGTADIYALADAFKQVPSIPLYASLMLVLVGFGFKVSMVPFHFWAPDVYEGAPTPVTGFLSTASKAAGFSVLARVLIEVFPLSDWQMVLAVLSAVTMTLGNLVAIWQTNIKRMLAYSSIAHAGYILMALAAGTEFGVNSMLYYIITYLLTNLAAFGFVIVYYQQTGTDEISDYAGLSRRNAGLAFGMLFTFLSLGGIPPLGGFFAKVLVFSAAVQANLVWLAVIGVLNAVIGLYYYLTVLKVVYLKRQPGDEVPLMVNPVHGLVLVFCVIGVVLMGTVMAPWFHITAEAAKSLF
ncbi:MAG: NADH-quinone oxidoreductase subunit N [Anaerolineales bacterium]|jgi:NADH-quinone oxidoreductase subunit N